MSKIALSGQTASVSAGPSRFGEGLLAEMATFWREFIKTAFVTYYPERHYMRGPGPACAAKRAKRAKAAKAAKARSGPASL